MNRCDSQVFFIFDSEFCQNEQDDPKDAIVYFYPPEIKAVSRCTLCCHLMGVARFLKFSFAPVSLIRLNKGTFATKSYGKYYLALKGKKDLPDNVLQRRLNFLIQLFVFYYKSFDAVEMTCGSREIFVHKMSCIWDKLLSVALDGDSSLELIFSIVPTIELPKTAGVLHLQAEEVLQACECHDGVLSGCVICYSRVLYSQLPMCLLHNLMLTPCQHNNKVFLGDVVPMKSGVPGNISLTYVYLDDEILQSVKDLNVVTFSRLSDAVQMEDNGSRQNEEDPSCVPALEPAEAFNEECAFLSSVGHYLQDPDAGVDDSCSKTYRAFFARPPQQPISTVPRLQENGIDMPSSYETCVENSEEFNRFNNSVESLTSFASNHVREPVIRTVPGKFSPEASRNPIAIEVHQPVYDSVEADDVRFAADIAEEDLVIDMRNGDTARQFILYQQECGDSRLNLLLDCCAGNDPLVIRQLSNIGRASIPDVQKEIKHCLEMSTAEGLEESHRYLFLQYDKKWQSAKGNMLHIKETSYMQQFLRRCIWLIHEDFQADDTIHDITVHAQDTVIYSNQMGSKETFYHQKLLGISDSRKCSCFPHQNDIVSRISMIAKGKLEKDQKIILL